MVLVYYKNPDTSQMYLLNDILNDVLSLSCDGESQT